ncbi:MAG: OB-fold nucleic acid binding domain-containing protein [Acidobacteria bacterium]|nr:OB-fold nucleic acid binding domain-containing protein [Acidobacteriota bacterium]
MRLLRRRSGTETARADTDDATTTPIGSIVERRQVTITGQVLGIRIRPSDELPTLVVRLGDDTGSVTLVWTGRRAVGGVTLGRRLSVDGTPVRSPDGVCIYNPTYRLL